MLKHQSLHRALSQLFQRGCGLAPATRCLHQDHAQAGSAAQAEVEPDMATGADLLHDVLLERDVDTVFGYPGGAILPVFDAIYESEHFKFILPRHEQGGGHMAEGYARVTGKPGVLIVTSGPGATNAVTPMQDALMDGTPMVVLSGQVPRAMLGMDAFQEADVVGITRSCTKWNVQAQTIAELPGLIHKAFDVAMSGRPGPVLVDLPKDVTAGSIDRATAAPTVRGPPLSKVTETIVDPHQIERILDMLNQAEKPIIYAGQGVVQAEASELLRQLAIKANIPVTTTLMGMGSFDECHPLSLRMLGMHGNAAANLAMQEADLILAIGARFDDRVTGNLNMFAPKARLAEANGTGGIVHFEITGKNVNKCVAATETVFGDLKIQLDALLGHGGLQATDRSPWLAQLKQWEEDMPFGYAPGDAEGPIKPQAVIEELYKQVEDRTEDVILTTGVGCHQMWAAQFYRWRHPGTMVTSGGLGTMGYGLPAAIGAQLGAPDKIVVDVDGDASFMMTMTELATAAQYNIPIKVLILNNDFQGMVKQWQDLFYDERYSHTRMHNPDFAKLAESMGVLGLTASNHSELAETMEKFINYKDGPVVMEAKVLDNEHVFPMVAAGKALHQMTLSATKQL